MNFDNIVLSPLYQTFGADAVLRIGQTDHALRVIDQTDGIEVSGGPLSMPTVKPVAMCRITDIAGLGLTNGQLIDALLTVNGSTWTVKNVAPKPGTAGRSSGELMLILINGDL